MGKNIYLAFLAMFIAFCMALIGGVWWSMKELRAYREEYDMLSEESANASRIMASMQSRNLSLTEVAGLNVENAGAASDTVEFSSHVQNAIETNNLNIISLNSDQQKPNQINLNIQGNYYSLAQLFADFRMMPFASRITSLKIHRDQANPIDFVDAEIVIEAILSGDHS